MNDGDELDAGGSPSAPGPAPSPVPPPITGPEPPADAPPQTPAPSSPADYGILVESKTVSFPKYGFQSFQTLDPPKRYLKRASSQSFRGGCPESGPLGVNGQSSTTVDELTGAETTAGDTFVNTGGDPQSPVRKAGSSNLSSYDDPPNDKGDCTGKLSYFTLLSDENTTPRMVTNGKSKLDAFEGGDALQPGTPFAYRNVHENELRFDYQKTQFKFKWDEDVAEEDRHALTYLVVFTPEDDPDTTEDESEAKEIVKTIEWNGQSAESTLYSVDPETEKPNMDGEYSLLSVDFEEFAANTGFDNYERLLEAQKLERPWLSVPDTNKVKMLREPADTKLALSTKFDAGKLGSVTPEESEQSPEILTITGEGPWGNAENSYEGTLRVGQSDVLNLAVYKRRTRTLAVHAITLTNDDVDSGIMKGNGKPNTICIRKGAGQGTLWTGVTGGDDVLVSSAINTGANGICDTPVIDARDEQVIPVGKGEPYAVIVQPGPNGVLNTASNDRGEIWEVGGTIIDDDTVVGESITTGADGIRETSAVRAAQAPINTPTQAQIQEKLDRIFGEQANIYFIIKPVNEVSVAYDVGDQAGAYPEYPRMANPNGQFDYFTKGVPSPEEELVKAVADDATADFNLYYFGSEIFGYSTHTPSSGPAMHFLIDAVGYARSAIKSPYVRAYDWTASLQDQDSPEVLVSIGAHELAHNDLFEPKTGLAHPREPEKIDGVWEYIPSNPEKNYTLKREEDDRKRLMWPNYQEVTIFPEMLLKDECDRLHGIKTNE